MTGSQSRGLALGMVFSLVSCGLAALPTALQAKNINLGVMDDISFDQPFVQLALEDPADSGVQVGPLGSSNKFMLDTGANAFTFAAGAYGNGENYKLATREDGSTVQFEELGVAGSQLFDVFQPYNVNVFDSNGNIGDVIPATVIGSPSLDLGDITGIAGMPAMSGRIVHWDLTPLGPQSLLDLGPINVSFISSALPATPNQYHITLPMLAADPQAGQLQSGDPLPTYADIPQIQVNVGSAAQAAPVPTTLIFDSGAQLSVMDSTFLQDQLGFNLDPNSPDNDFLKDEDGNIMTLPLGGIGGTVNAPLVHLNHIGIPTDEGDELDFNSLDVLVVDIPGLTGVLGMNAWTTGYFDYLGTGMHGAFDSLTLDFTGTDGLLTLNMNPDYIPTTVPEPASALFLLVPFLFALNHRRRRA